MYESKTFKPSETDKTKRSFNPVIMFINTHVK